MQSQTVKLIGGWIAGLGLVALALIVFAFSTLNVWYVSVAIFRGDTIRAVLNVLLYDFGMLVWLGAFFFLCHSVPQYAIAAIAFIVNLVAVLAINVLSINAVQAQSLMGEWAVYVIEGIVMWHLLASFAHIGAHPWVWGQIERGVKHAEVISKAYEKANRLMDDQAEELAHDYAAGIHREAVAEIRGNGGGKDKPSVKQLTTTAEHAPIVYQRPASNGNGHSTGANGSNPT